MDAFIHTKQVSRPDRWNLRPLLHYTELRRPVRRDFHTGLLITLRYCNLVRPNQCKVESERCSKFVFLTLLSLWKRQKSILLFISLVISRKFKKAPSFCQQRVLFKVPMTRKFLLHNEKEYLKL